MIKVIITMEDKKAPFNFAAYVSIFLFAMVFTSCDPQKNCEADFFEFGDQAVCVDSLGVVDGRVYFDYTIFEGQKTVKESVRSMSLLSSFTTSEAIAERLLYERNYVCKAQEIQTRGYHTCVDSIGKVYDGLYYRYEAILYAPNDSLTFGMNVNSKGGYTSFQIANKLIDTYHERNPVEATVLDTFLMQSGYIITPPVKLEDHNE